MLCKAAQRPGALANLTVEEFDSGLWDRTAEPALYTTQTQFHKTLSSEGEAARGKRRGGSDALLERDKLPPGQSIPREDQTSDSRDDEISQKIIGQFQSYLQ